MSENKAARFNNIIGKQYGNLKILRYLGVSKAYPYWHYCLCKCKCGNKLIAPIHKVVRRSITSCGCAHMQGKLVQAFTDDKEPYDMLIERGKQRFMLVENNLYISNIELEGTFKDNIFYVSVECKKAYDARRGPGAVLNLVTAKALCECGRVYDVKDVPRQFAMCPKCFESSEEGQKWLEKKRDREQSRRFNDNKYIERTGKHKKDNSGYIPTSAFSKIEDAYKEYTMTGMWD